MRDPGEHLPDYQKRPSVAEDLARSRHGAVLSVLFHRAMISPGQRALPVHLLDQMGPFFGLFVAPTPPDTRAET